MLDKELINIEHGARISFETVEKIKFPNTYDLRYWEHYLTPIASTPELRYRESRGFIQAIAVSHRGGQKDPYKLARVVLSLSKDADWSTVIETPVIFIARFHINSAEDYSDLVNFRAKTLLRRKAYYLELIESFDWETDEENEQEAMSVEGELYGMGISKEITNRPYNFHSDDIVIPGRPSILNSISFELINTKLLEHPNLF